MGGGFLYYLASNGDCYGSWGATAEKSGILGGVEISNLDLSTPNSNIGAYRSIRYHLEKVSKTWAKVLSSTWVPTATFTLPGG